MRRSLLLVGIPVAVLGAAAAVAVAKYRTSAQSNDQFSNDLERAQAVGLDLAQAQGSKKYALTEIASESKPQPSKTIKQGSGTKAIRSKAPTVKAAPEPVAAVAVEQAPPTQVIESPAAPTTAEIPAPAVPRPVPQGSEGPILAGGTGRGRTGSDGGMGIGGILGAILRGGVADGDNCDPRTDGHHGGRRRPVYGGVGGMGGVRMQVLPELPNGGLIIGGSRPRF